MQYGLQYGIGTAASQLHEPCSKQPGCSKTAVRLLLCCCYLASLCCRPAWLHAPLRAQAARAHAILIRCIAAQAQGARSCRPAVLRMRQRAACVLLQVVAVPR
jgi:hypothetical protein